MSDFPTSRWLRLLAAPIAAWLLALLLPALLASTGAPAARVECAAMDPACAAGPFDTDAGSAAVVVASGSPDLAVVRDTRSDSPPPQPPRRAEPAPWRFAPEPMGSASAASARPNDGLDVPACRGLARWCLAHATATSPA